MGRPPSRPCCALCLGSLLLHAAAPATAAAVDLEQRADLGRCICDLAAGECDAHCCCDPDCAGDGLAELRRSFDCLPEGPGNRSAHRCYSKAWVRNVNPRVDLWVVADDLRGLLCVQVDNNPVQGVFFANDAEVPAGRIDEARREQQLSSFPAALAQGDGPGTMVSRGYHAGDVLKVHMGLLRPNGTVIDLEEGSPLQQAQVIEVVAPLPLRLPDALGRCAVDSRQPARFLVDVRPTSCWLGPVDLESSCSSALNPRMFGTWLLRKMELPDDMRCGTDRCLPPRVNVSCSSDSAAESNRTEPPACIAGWSAVLQDAVWWSNGTSCGCQGALREVQYTFRYGYDARYDAVVVSEAEVHITLQDVFGGSQLVPVVVVQTTSTRFVQRSDPAVVRGRSGNPGYLSGLPLLVATCRTYDPTNGRCVEFDGKSPSSGVAVAQGILPDGACANLTEAGRSAAMHFGEDALFGCTLELTRQELADLCVPIRAGADMGFARYLRILSLPWTHVAAFGSVAPGSQDAGDWVEVAAAGSAEVEALKFSDDDMASGARASASSCRGAVVGVDLEVLYSPFGEVHNPQFKVVAARKSRRMGVLAHTRLDPAAKQAFQFTVTLSFVQLGDSRDREAEVPPRPPMPRILPHDLFYPFKLGSSRGSRRARVPLAAVAVATAAGLGAGFP